MNLIPKQVTVDSRPSLFLANRGLGSLFVYFNTPHRAKDTCRFVVPNQEASINIIVGSARSPVAMHILNAWRVSGLPREMDIYDYQLKWELYERAVVLVQFCRHPVEEVAGVVGEALEIAHAWVDHRLSAVGARLSPAAAKA